MFFFYNFFYEAVLLSLTGWYENGVTEWVSEWESDEQSGL